MKRRLCLFIVFVFMLLPVGDIYAEKTLARGDSAIEGSLRVAHDANVEGDLAVDGSITAQQYSKKLFVCSTTGHDSAGNYGKSYKKPFASVLYAITQCTASKNDIIYVLPGHSESLANATALVLDKAGITIIGCGVGDLRPTFTFTTAAAAAIPVSSADCKMVNCIFVCNIANQNHMFDIAADDFTLEDCEFKEGSATGLSFVTADTADGDSDRLTLKNCKFYAPTAGNMDAAIQISKDFTGVRILNCDIYGDFDNASIEIPAGGNAQVDCQISNCSVYNLQTGIHAIEINGTNSTGKIINCNLFTDTQSASVDAGGLECFNVLWHGGTDQVAATPAIPLDDASYNYVGVDDNDNAAATTNVASNRDGSILERTEFIAKYLETGTAGGLVAPANTRSILDILGSDGTTTTGALAGSLLGAIGTNEAAADTPFSSSAVEADANGSALERLEALATGSVYSAKHPNYLAVTADFLTASGWETAASHEIATVTGMVEMIIIPQCTETLTDAADGASIQLGIAGTTNAIIASTGAAGAGGNTVSTNEFWLDATPADVIVTKTLMNATDIVVGGGLDVGYEVTGAAMTDGTIIFHIFWWPLDATGAVTAGAGGTL